MYDAQADLDASLTLLALMVVFLLSLEFFHSF